MSPAQGQGVVSFQCVARAGVPNEPMLPTAPHPPDEHPLFPLRRHIGRPLGNGATGQWATSSGLRRAKLGRSGSPQLEPPPTATLDNSMRTMPHDGTKFGVRARGAVRFEGQRPSACHDLSG